MLNLRMENKIMENNNNVEDEMLFLIFSLACTFQRYNGGFFASHLCWVAWYTIYSHRSNVIHCVAITIMYRNKGKKL